MLSIISWLSSLTALAGEPTINQPSGNSLFSVTSAPAPTKQLLPILALLRIVAPIPIKELLPIVQPCIIALCPMVQLLPIVTGQSGSTWMIVFSCIFVSSPILITSLSPLKTDPNQIPTSFPKTTFPMTCASGATQYKSLSGN